MKRLTVRNRDRDTILGRSVALADRWWPRLRGLIGRPEPGDGEGLLIAPSQGVHMYWMKYALDVVILDREKRVLALYPDLEPGGRTRMHWKASFALELPAGTLARCHTAVGDGLEWND